MSERVCIECRNHHVILEGEPGDLPQVVECRARPPTVFMLATGTQRLDGKQGVQVNFPAAWPQVQPLSWCGSFVRRILFEPRKGRDAEAAERDLARVAAGELARVRANLTDGTGG